MNSYTFLLYICIFLIVCVYPLKCEWFENLKNLFSGPFFDGNLRKNIDIHSSTQPTFLQFYTPINTHTHTEKFAYHNYEQIIQNFKNLAENFPNLVNYTTANELYPHIEFDTHNDYKCANYETCVIPIITVHNKQTYTHKTPQIFLSGALHGDEIAGVEMAWQVANFLTKEYGTHPFVNYMVDNVSVVIMPFANAWGYYHFQRKELDEDPNRDYSSASTGGFKTFSAKAMHHLYYDNLFAATITWHGGTEAITYEWGDYDHCTYTHNKYISNESPDFTSQTIIASHLNFAAYNFDVTYMVGPMCDVVYPVFGGMEDWAYSASWLKDTYPNNEILYKGAPFPPYNDHSFRSSTFLIETANDKQHSNLGEYSDIYYPKPSEGVVSQNVRMALKFIEFVHPQILLEIKEDNIDISKGFLTNIVGVGCEIISDVQFQLYEGHCLEVNKTAMPIYTQEVKNTANCLPMSVWEFPTLSSMFDTPVANYHYPIEFTEAMEAGDYCGMVVAKFDQHWGQQINPDPPIKPQTLLAKFKLEEGYTASTADGSHTFEGHINWYFPKHNKYKGINMYVPETY